MGRPSLPSPMKPTRMRRNPNQCRHETHATKTVRTVQGDFLIYDWTQYQDEEGYCSGKDDVSMTLDLYGIWEPIDYERSRHAKGFLVDFGAHIGWYARGHECLAVEPDPENVRLLRANTDAEIFEGWTFDIGSLTRRPDFVIADIEGDEYDAMRLIRPWLGEIPLLLIECSPEFGDYYPALIDEMHAAGYSSAPELGETQANVWFWL